MRFDLLTFTINSIKEDNFSVTFHGLIRMSERSASRFDIINVANSVIKASVDSTGRVKLKGKDSLGQTLEVIAAYNGETIIITVF